MILKKPYGFIIKHFRLINLILLIPTLYVTICFSDIAKFLRQLVNNRYSTFETGISGKYITIWLLASLVFLILFNLLLYGLMKKKKKSTKIYTFSIIYYFVLFLLSLLLYNQLTTIELGKIDTTIIGIYKDVCNFIPFAGYFLIISTFFNSVGFNIKTLKFDQSIDLQLTEEDTEEFELAGRENQADIKKITIHTIRELRYYIVENRFIVTCIVVLILFVIASNIYINIGFYNKKYVTNENLALNNMIFSIKESYITNVDQGGNTIADNKYFLVVKLGIENSGWKDTAISQKDLRIDVKENRLYPTLDLGDKFLDISKNYDGKSIPPKIIQALDNPKYNCPEGYVIIGNKCSNKKDHKDPEIEHNYYCPKGYELKSENCEIPPENTEYQIVYIINKDQIQSSYTMKILNRTKNDIGELNPSYKMITFKPKNLLNIEDMGIIKLGDEMNLKETSLGETKIRIDNINLSTSYYYNYEYCTNSKSCEIKKDVITASIGKVLVIIDDSITYDEKSSFYLNTSHEFYKYFGKINYKYNEKEYSELLKDVTPSKLKNKRIYEISSTINYATNKELVITIRNKSFKIAFE